MKRIFLFFISIKFLFAINILILNSYSVQFPWTRGEIKGILKKLKNKHLKIYIEFMDTKNFKPSKRYLNDFYNFLKIKYKKIPLDIVIVTDDNALNFVISHKKDFFKQAKVFFAGINNLNIVKKIDRNDFTGVFEKKEPIKNLIFAKKVVPNLKYVYVVADNSVSGNSVMKEYKNAFKNIKNFNFIYINDENLTRVLRLISDSPKNSAMLLLTPFSFVYSHQRINYKKAIHLISKYFSHPIIIHTDILASLKNCNIIGGRVTDAFSQGESVANKVLEYLKGEKVKNIKFTYENANKMYINVKNLEKFGINPYSLGYKNSLYVNEKKSVWEEYKYLIVCIVILFFLMISFIVVLYIKNKKLQAFSKNTFDIENEIKKKIINEIDLKQAKINALNRYFEFVLNIIKRNVYENRKKEVLLKQISFFQKFLFEKNTKNIKECIADIIKAYNPTSKNIKIEGEKSFLKLEPLVLSHIIFYILENCDKITIKILENEIKIFLEEHDLSLEKLKENLENLKVNINFEKKGKILIISIKN